MSITPATILADGTYVLPRHYHNGPVLVENFSETTTLQIPMSKVNRNFYGGVGEFVIITNGGDPVTKPQLRLRIYNDTIPFLPVTPESVGEPYDEIGVGYGETVMLSTNDNGMDYVFVAFFGPSSATPPNPPPKHIILSQVANGTEISLTDVDRAYVRATMGIPSNVTTLMGNPVDGCVFRLVVHLDPGLPDVSQALELKLVSDLSIEGSDHITFMSDGNVSDAGTYTLVYQEADRTFIVM